MSQPSFPNEYVLRTVAESASKACIICHRSTTKVLITVDNKDFLYVCTSHLTDRGFASPIVDEKVEAEKKKQEELAKEKEAVIKEYEEKRRKKDKDAKTKTDPVKVAEEEKEAKLLALDAKAGGSIAVDDGPRHFTLHRNFYQMRIDRKANIEKARRDQARMTSTNFFPVTPRGNIE